jgi:hypothetical protein
MLNYTQRTIGTGEFLKQLEKKHKINQILGNDFQLRNLKPGGHGNPNIHVRYE